MKLLFPKQNYNVLSRSSYTHIYFWEIHIFPGFVCLYCCRDICGLILGIDKSLVDTWMWKLGLRPRNSQKRNTEMGFSLQCRVITLSNPHLRSQDSTCWYTRRVRCWELGALSLWDYNYLCTYDFYGPVHNVFDAGQPHPRTSPPNVSAHIKNITHKALEIIGA